MGRLRGLVRLRRGRCEWTCGVGASLSHAKMRLWAAALTRRVYWPTGKRSASVRAEREQKATHTDGIRVLVGEEEPYQIARAKGNPAVEVIRVLYYLQTLLSF